ncbi:MAG: hypothetical protein ACXADY_20105 [Candidatus Hodarchaeales archaeon]|jgi:hypothetical protein
MQKNSLKKDLFVLILLVIAFTFISSTQATYQSDLLNDVQPISGNSGDFVDYIDLNEVILQGTSIIITTDGDLTTLNTGIATYFIVLLSDDGDPTDFEACIMLYHDSPGQDIAYWTTEDPLADIGVDWGSDYTRSHSQITSNEVILHFGEFAGTIYSELLVVSVAQEGSEYYDWAPNSYTYTVIHQIFSKVLPTHAPAGSSPPPTTTPTTTTTPPTTTPTTTTTPPITTPTTTTISPTTTTISTTTTDDANPIIIPKTTLDDNTTKTNTIDQTDTSSDVLTSSLTTTKPSTFITGFSVPIIVLCLPLVLIKRRQEKS